MVSYSATLAALGQRVRRLRIFRDLPRRELADRAGVGLATLQRFEQTGQTSLENALRIATALGAEAGFDKLFEAPTYRTLDEALKVPDLVTRKRVRRRK